MTVRAMTKEQRKEYDSIHRWVHSHYGNAKLCESNECTGVSKRFEWALIKGEDHKRDRRVYMMLCKSCHIKYDLNDEWKIKMSHAHSGEKNHMFGVSIKGKDHHFYGKNHSLETRKKLQLKRAKISPDDLNTLRKLHSVGVKQTVLSKKFVVS